ncbi:hypothetical protein [Foetidibacter luteolus]|uniref:hypothetical protein n=1 Tax=Foetidibacter luteolus TaxID=2608880 RepID=UPI00129A5E64|nr:hypothetical protein [Foetidibacter luteolus]
MYDVKPNLVIGFHGCDLSVRNALVNNPDEVRTSKQPYDWLGHGMYFWENNYERALHWATEKSKRGAPGKPSVVGAVLSLGYCCDFLDSKYISILQSYFTLMAAVYKAAGKKLPYNKDIPQDKHKDKILRELDCASIEFMHGEILRQINQDTSEKGFSHFNAFDTVRGVFTEGGPAFDGAGIFEKSHIQICVRNLNCIKGFFIPRKEIDFTGLLQ